MWAFHVRRHTRLNRGPSLSINRGKGWANRNSWHAKTKEVSKKMSPRRKNRGLPCQASPNPRSQNAHDPQTLRTALKFISRAQEAPRESSAQPYLTCPSHQQNGFWSSSGSTREPEGQKVGFGQVNRYLHPSGMYCALNRGRAQGRLGRDIKTKEHVFATGGKCFS